MITINCAWLRKIHIKSLLNFHNWASIEIKLKWSGPPLLGLRILLLCIHSDPISLWAKNQCVRLWRVLKVPLWRLLYLLRRLNCPMRRGNFIWKWQYKELLWLNLIPQKVLEKALDSPIKRCNKYTTVLLTKASSLRANQYQKKTMFPSYKIKVDKTRSQG